MTERAEIPLSELRELERLLEAGYEAAWSAADASIADFDDSAGEELRAALVTVRRWIAGTAA